MVYNEFVKDLTSRASFTHLLARHTNRRALLDEAGLHTDSHYDGVSAVENELWQHTQLAWEHSNMLELLLTLALQLVPVLDEGIKQMVDDVRCEDPHPQCVSQLLRLSFHLHIKCQDHSISECRESSGFNTSHQ